MAQSLSEARARAIIELQDIRKKRSANSFEHAVADYAIDLVLNETRPEGPYLVANALQDAKSILTRQKRRDRLRYGELQLIDNVDGASANSPSATLAASPEAALEWADGYRKLKAWADQRSSRCGAVLHDWRAGMTGAQSARQRRVSERTIDCERHGLRQAATRLFAEAA